MNVNKFINAIGYSEQAKKVYYEMAVDSETYQKQKQRYYTDEEGFLQDLKESAGDKYYQAILYYFTNFAVDIYPEYIKKGFSEEQYIHTFTDFRIWNEACILETGICGLKEVYWLTSHLHAGIIRLGRMQFQPDELGEDINFNGKILKAGQKILNVHIPAGGSLDKEEMQKSFDLARKYFGENSYVHAESWLLDPLLENYLSKDSNILCFAHKFSVYKVEEHNSIERYVFGVIKQNKNEYEAKNSFQQKIKQALLDGVKFNSGYGIMQL